MKITTKLSSLITSAAALAISAGVANADQVFADDVIVQGSLCAGFDCSNGESFGFDTIRLKENNTRLHFDDTSNTASFPSNDWRLVANDTTNGGANRFSIEDATAGRSPFTIEAGAPANSLYVDSSGRMGIQTNNPVVLMHARDGNTPTLRLEQDGSDGFQAQTYDVAANEANFFVRDVTNGSSLFFRAEPGAPQNSLYIDRDGNIGKGTADPQAELHLTRSDASSTRLFIENTNAADQAVQIRLISNSDNNRRIIGQNESGSQETQISLNNDHIILAGPTVGGSDLWARIDASGITTLGPTCSSAPCDRTFDPDYFEVPSIEEHAEFMWTNQFLEAVGPTGPHLPFNVAEKSAGMLHELEVAHIYIEQLHERLEALEAKLEQ